MYFLGEQMNEWVDDVGREAETKKKEGQRTELMDGKLKKGKMQISSKVRFKKNV